MLRGFLLWVTAIAAALPVATAAEPQRWALLIGVNDYVEFDDLQYSVNDAAGLADTLRQSGFDKQRVFLITDEAKEAPFHPIKANIERQFEKLLAVAEKDDLVIVGFCGHGIHINGKSYLCPSEANADRPVETMIAVDDVYAKFAQCKAALKLLIVDACRNDPRPEGKRSANAKVDVKSLGATFERPPEGIVVLASCAPGQTSWEDKNLKHGVFMHHVLKGLAGEADGNKNGRITLFELYDYASDATKLYVLNRFNDAQVPAQRGEINGVFELPRSTELTNSIGMRFSLIPAGEFLMGSPPSDADAEEDERPQHPVRITKPFYMSRFETTIGQFATFVQDRDYRTEPEKDGAGGYGYNGATNKLEGRSPQFTWKNTGYALTEEHPVVNVTWNDAQEFCRWLSRKEGKTYRLPTEAEWEYACRAGTTTKYFHGDDPEGLAVFANIADRTFRMKKPSGLEFGIEGTDGHVFTAPVGQFSANDFGLFDMTGNLNEWCNDWYGPFTDALAVDPAGPNEGEKRVFRGASWGWSGKISRIARRMCIEPDKCADISFRLVLVP